MSFNLRRVRDWLLRKNLCRKPAPAPLSLMARVSYELRTSLNGIMGYAEFLENRTAEPMMNFTAKIIRESGSNLARSCNAYVDLQYVQRGQVRLSNTPFIFATLLHDLVSLYQPQALERSIHLQLIYHADAQTKSICADATRMRQVLDTVIFNTLQIAEAWDVIRIHLSWHEDKKYLKLVIESTEAKLEQNKLKLVEAFWNTDTYQFQLQEGPGVEMALAKSLIRLAGISARYELNQGRIGTLELQLPTC